METSLVNPFLVTVFNIIIIIYLFLIFNFNKKYLKLQAVLLYNSSNIICL